MVVVLTEITSWITHSDANKNKCYEEWAQSISQTSVVLTTQNIVSHNYTEKWKFRVEMVM